MPELVCLVVLAGEESINWCAVSRQSNTGYVLLVGHHHKFDLVCSYIRGHSFDLRH